MAVALCVSCEQKETKQRAYAWLMDQQNGQTGLLGNQEDDDFSGVYPNALAAICFVHQGDVARAERIFQFFDNHFEAEFAPDTPGGFHQFWDARTGTVHGDTDRWVGDNAWLLIALNYYQKQTDRNDFSTMQNGIAQWLISLQDADGGILSGFTKAGPMMHKSTEGNLDCYAALEAYPEARRKIRDWLTSQMWVASEQRFRMGSTVAEAALDGVSWGIAALGPEYSNSLVYAEQQFQRTDKSEGSGNAVTGFADFLGKPRVWLEGTGQMAVAYNAVGQKARAEDLVRELEQAMVPSAKFPGTMGIPCSTSDPAWQGATRKIFVPSQTWYLFGAWDFNPMESAQ